MRTALPFLMLAVLAGCSRGGLPMTTPRTNPSFVTPDEAVGAYLHAGDVGGSRLIRAAFHPSTPVQWVDAQGTPQAIAQIDWWPRFDEGSPQPAVERTQRLLDREGGLALIEAVSRWETHTFDDLLLAVATPEGFRIVGKVFVRLEHGETAAARPEDEQAIRQVLDTKIEAHAAYDPALLRASHLSDCRYYRVGVDGVPFSFVTLSEAAARYAAFHDRGEQDRESPWRTLSVTVRGNIAAAKLDVLVHGERYIDYLLLLRTRAGWRIAAAAWGDPSAK
jgi:hypothetical protein